MCPHRMPAAFKAPLACWIALCLYQASLLGQSLLGQSKPPAKPNFATTFEQRKIEYLRTLLPSLEKIQNFIGKGEAPAPGYHPNAGWTYDAELGWVLRDTIRQDEGVDGSRTFYRYEKSGARRRVHFADTTARVHTYGDSFTHCDQVNDGETWQEYLAAHLREPIENFGVGGYSVYQAYKRMKVVEKTHPAEYIVLNIYDDDHYRNLDSWRSIGRHDVREGTLPHVRVNVSKNHIVEVPNLCPTPQHVYKLRDLNWVLQTFGDDPVLHRAVLAATAGPIPAQAVSDLAAGFGVAYSPGGRATVRAEDREQIHTQAALFSTIKILQMVEKYVAQTGKKLFVILSYGPGNMKRHLLGENRFDQVLVDYLKIQEYPFVDLREWHLAEFKSFNLDVDTYIKRYYIGHYNPSGNFFSAWAIKNKIVEWLDPKPKPYRSQAEID